MPSTPLISEGSKRDNLPPSSRTRASADFTAFSPRLPDATQSSSSSRPGTRGNPDSPQKAASLLHNVPLQGKTMPEGLDGSKGLRVGGDVVRDVHRAASPSLWGAPRQESRDFVDSTQPQERKMSQLGTVQLSGDQSDSRRSSRRQSESVFGSRDSSHTPDDLEDDVYWSEDAMAAIQEYGQLDPIVRAAREECFCNSLVVCDLTKSPRLCDHFKRYNLTDFFDERGQRRYQNLSMSFAAKQHAEIQGMFGSKASDGKSMHDNHSHHSARSYRLACAMVQRDRENAQKRMKDQFQNYEEIDKLRKEDVKKRQHEMLFFEVENYEYYLPEGVVVEKLLPLDVDRVQDREERRRFEQLNARILEAVDLEENGQRGNTPHAQAQLLAQALEQWLLHKDELGEALANIASWTSASGLSPATGIDRSVFCRFLLDVGLVDQDTIPYVWAVSVFDQFARPVRVSGLCDAEWCPNSDSSVSEHVAFALQLCKWDFINALDTLLKRRHTRQTVGEFLHNMRKTTEHLSEQWRAQENEASPSALAEKELAAKVSPISAASQAMMNKLSAAPNNAGSKDHPTKHGALTMFGDDDKRSLASESMVWKRNRLISGMLAEPEVLQIVEQLRPIFKELFDIYTDDPAEKGPMEEAKGENATRHMEFVNFVQFCQDLRIVPRLATMHDVWRAYGSAECLDFPEGHRAANQQQSIDEAEKQEPTPEMLKQQAMQEFVRAVLGSYRDLATAFVAIDTSRNGSVNFSEFRSACNKIGFAGDVKAIYRDLEKPGAGINRQAFEALDKGGPSPSKSPQSAMKGGRASLLQTSDLSEDVLRNFPRKQNTRASLSFAEADVPTKKAGRTQRLSIAGKNGIPKRLSASPAPAPLPPQEEEAPTAPAQPQFGVGAFAETLCRIALTYLLVHGNSVQLATGSRAKMVWLLAYLQSTLEHLKQSIGRRRDNQTRRSTVRRVKTLPSLAGSVATDNKSPNGEASSESSPATSPKTSPRGNQRPSLLQRQTQAADDSRRNGPPVVSHRLARVLERFLPSVFEALKPMELQRSSYTTSPQVTSESTAARGAGSFDSPTRSRASMEKIATAQKRQRRKSRHKEELALEFGLLQATATLAGTSPTTPAGDDGDLLGVGKSPWTPQHGKRNFSLKDAGRTLMLQNKSAKSVLSKILDKGKAGEGASVSPSARPSIAGNRRKFDTNDSQQTPSQDSDEEFEKKRPATSPRKSTHKKKLEIMEPPAKQEKGPVKEDVVQNAIDQRPAPPLLQDDNFNFDDLLFKRLLRPVSPIASKRGQKQSVLSNGHTSENTANGALDPTASITSPWSRSRNSSGASSGSAEMHMPGQTTLTKDRCNLIKGLTACIGKIDRCNLSPPPMNAYAVQLNARISHMMGWEEEGLDMSRRRSE